VQLKGPKVGEEYNVMQICELIAHTACSWLTAAVPFTGLTAVIPAVIFYHRGNPRGNHGGDIWGRSDSLSVIHYY